MKMEQTERYEKYNLKPTHSSYLPAYEDVTDSGFQNI